MKSPFRHIGPGALVTAAFIGPGTITVCSLAGYQFGLDLLWVIVWAVIATILLQQMAAKIGIVTGKGIAENVHTALSQHPIKPIAITLIFTAIVIGNLAYEAGNISGAVLGVEAIATSLSDTHRALINVIIALLAGILLWIGKYKFIEHVLVTLVILMSLFFCTAAILSINDGWAVVKGLLIPSISRDQLLLVVALIGTTVVPYNLFLHASVSSQKWKNAEDLKFAQWDTAIAVALGGLITISIIIVAAQSNGQTLQSAEILVNGLAQTIGPAAKWIVGIGIFCAGISSAITAPLAAALVARECFNWKNDNTYWKFRLTWFVVLFAGVAFSIYSINPLWLIQIAQMTNGLILPFTAAFILWVSNQKKTMGHYTNTPRNNLVTIILVLLTIALGLRSIFSLLDWI